MNECSQFTVKTKEEIEAFTKGKTFSLEIGCGKGSFICEIARRNPDRLFIAMERVYDVALLAAEKIKNNGLNNIRILVGNAAYLPEYFGEGTIDVIFLNFSDPWPKARHEKRRLTFRTFLETYKALLCDGGRIEFKTDNRPLFDFSLEEFRNCGFVLENVTYDLHESEFEKDNIHTEYEDNFSAKGFHINRAEAYKNNQQEKAI